MYKSESVRAGDKQTESERNREKDGCWKQVVPSTEKRRGGGGEWAWAA